jgi:hypothetical protein
MSDPIPTKEAVELRIYELRSIYVQSLKDYANHLRAHFVVPFCDKHGLRYDGRGNFYDVDSGVEVHQVADDGKPWRLCSDSGHIDIEATALLKMMDAWAKDVPSDVASLMDAYEPKEVEI